MLSEGHSDMRGDAMRDSSLIHLAALGITPDLSPSTLVFVPGVGYMDLRDPHEVTRYRARAEVYLNQHRPDGPALHLKKTPPFCEVRDRNCLVPGCGRWPCACFQWAERAKAS